MGELTSKGGCDLRYLARRRQTIKPGQERLRCALNEPAVRELSPAALPEGRIDVTAVLFDSPLLGVK
jgi:hypothetical protein